MEIPDLQRLAEEARSEVMDSIGTLGELREALETAADQCFNAGLDARGTAILSYATQVTRLQAQGAAYRTAILEIQEQLPDLGRV